MFCIVVFDLRFYCFFDLDFKLLLHSSNVDSSLLCQWHFGIFIVLDHVFPPKFFSEHGLEKALSHCCIYIVVVNIFSQKQPVNPIVLLIVDIASQVLLQCLILMLRLTICLRVKSNTIAQTYFEVIAEMRLEVWGEKQPSVTCEKYRYTIFGKNCLNENIR